MLDGSGCTRTTRSRCSRPVEVEPDSADDSADTMQETAVERERFVYHEQAHRTQMGDTAIIDGIRGVIDDVEATLVHLTLVNEDGSHTLELTPGALVELVKEREPGKPAGGSRVPYMFAVPHEDGESEPCDDCAANEFWDSM
ncbi:MAG: hypothetical protein Q4F67_17580 [Propionibacteriaceae bacterium]|nr:hypothetical protein [Propionibacteriaceae bacterium]